MESMSKTNNLVIKGYQDGLSDDNREIKRQTAKFKGIVMKKLKPGDFLFILICIQIAMTFVTLANNKKERKKLHVKVTKQLIKSRQQIYKKGKEHDYMTKLEKTHNKRKKKIKCNYLAEELESIKERLKEKRKEEKERKQKKTKGKNRCGGKGHKIRKKKD